MTQRGIVFCQTLSKPLQTSHASNIRGPRTPLKPRTLSRSSLRRIENTRKILGYIRVPRTAGTSNTFEALANFARFGTCAAKKQKNISSFNCQNIFITNNWSRANLDELKFCAVVWSKQHKEHYERHLFVPKYIPLLNQRLTDEPSTTRTIKIIKSIFAVCTYISTKCVL